MTPGSVLGKRREACADGVCARGGAFSQKTIQSHHCPPPVYCAGVCARAVCVCVRARGAEVCVRVREGVRWAMGWRVQPSHFLHPERLHLARHPTGVVAVRPHANLVHKS